MSAASQAMGLAESQDINKYKTWEDPARAWIDLVDAIKTNNQEQLKAMLLLAKKSQWTHEEWSDVTAGSDTEEDAEGDIYPAGQEDDFFNNM